MKPVYFNHDGGVDDLISLFLLLHMDNIELIGVSAIGADCYVEPAESASRKIINRFSTYPVDVATSYERGKIHSQKIGVCMLSLWTHSQF